MSLKDLWQTILGEIELNISRANFITWFRNTKIHSKNSGLVTIGVPNTFTKEWLENKYNKLILKALRNNSPDIKEIKFIIEGNAPLAKTLANKKDDFVFAEKQLKFQELSIDKETNLNPKYNFENFVIGSFNELAQAAGLAVIKH